MPLTNKTIVAIDDAQPILNFLAISLESLGVHFYSEKTATAGLKLCETLRPDLIVLDLGLPDKEGFNILPQLKALSAHSNTPIIVLTVRNTAEDREKAAELGASAYLTKPFPIAKFFDVVCSVLHIDKPLFPAVSGLLTDKRMPYAVMQEGA